VLFGPDERRGDEKSGSSQACGHRSSDDQPDPASTRPRGPSGLLNMAGLGSRRRRDHGGSSWMRAKGG
jgi:hypothetical protein